MTVNELLDQELSNYDMCLWGCMPYDTKYAPRSIFELNTCITPQRVIMAIGPEGDFTDLEKERLIEKKGIPVVLSKNTLRVETAAMAMLAGVEMRWGVK